MRVVALQAFVARIGLNSQSIAKGSEFDLPDGVDWLQAGLVAPVAQAEPALPHLVGVEHAIDPAPAQAEKRKRKI
jgi:hypothetical protein